MERNGYDQVAAEGFALETSFENVSQRVRERHAIGVLEMMNDLTQGAGKKQSRPREVKHVLTLGA